MSKSVVGRLTRDSEVREGEEGDQRDVEGEEVGGGRTLGGT